MLKRLAYIRESNKTDKLICYIESVLTCLYITLVEKYTYKKYIHKREI